MANRDIEGLSPEAQERRRWSAVQTRLHTRDFVLSDDLGTKFRATHGNAGGSQGEQWGVRAFVPAVPAGASALHLQFHNAQLNIQLK